MNETREFKYFFRLRRYLLAFLVMICSSLFLLFLAVKNERGLIIEVLIRLNPKQANIFYFTSGSFLLLLNSWVLASSIFIRKKIVVYENKILIPNLMTGKSQLIYFNNIALVADRIINKQRMLTIFTKNNKHYSIVLNFLDSINEYEAIFSTLLHRD